MSDTAVRSRLGKVIHILDRLPFNNGIEGNPNPFELVINLGEHDGVKLGDRFLVFGDGPRVSDPDTGKDLGTIEVVRGRGEAIHVQSDIATLRSVERRKGRLTKRVIRDTANNFPLVIRSGQTGTVHEEFEPDAELPFHGVAVGDFVKPI